MIKSVIILIAAMGVGMSAFAQELPPDEPGMDAATSRENPRSNIAFDTGRHPPTCENRWDKFLPLLGQAACEQGYVLPRPFGLSMGYMHQDQPFDVNGINVSLGNLNSSDAATVTEVQNEESTVTLRADVWLLPFWNVYGILGHTDGEATGGLKINLPPCNLPNNTSCPTVFNLDYQADVIGVGTTIAGGYKDFFGMIDFNQTTADLNISVTDAEATVVSARLGWNGKLGFFAGVLWVGAMYQKIDQELTLVRPVDNEMLTVIIDQETQKPLNYVFGGQWDFTRSWSALLELGVGGRKSQMLNLTYRF